MRSEFHLNRLTADRGDRLDLNAQFGFLLRKDETALNGILVHEEVISIWRTL